MRRMVPSSIWYTRRLIMPTTPWAEEVALVFSNPTAGTATSSYCLAKVSAERAEVLDAVGRKVASLAAGERQLAGPHMLAVPKLAPGLYKVQLRHEGAVAYRKLMVE